MTMLWMEMKIKTHLDKHVAKTHTDTPGKIGKWLTGWLNRLERQSKPCPESLLSWVLSFLTPIDNFCHHVKTPAARGSAVFHSMENRWRGRAEMAAWKKKRGEKKRLTHWGSHWDPAEHGTHSPDESDRGSVCLSLCVFISGELCLCMYLSKLFACSGVCDEAN